jgi:hypothetical protein
MGQQYIDINKAVSGSVMLDFAPPPWEFLVKKWSAHGFEIPSG